MALKCLLFGILACFLAVQGEEIKEVPSQSMERAASPKACRYEPVSVWSHCDPKTFTKSRMMILLHGNSSYCSKTRVSIRQCHRLKKMQQHPRKEGVMSPPQDLTVFHPNRSDPSTVILSWQPPLHTTLGLSGFIVMYSTELSEDVHDWTMVQVPKEKLSVTIDTLAPNTTYFFSILAVGPRGLGPRSRRVSHTTPQAQ